MANMKNNKIVVVDTDAIVALYNPNDSLNKRAKMVIEFLVKNNYSFYYPSTVIVEALMLFQRVFSDKSELSRFVDLIRKEEIKILTVDEHLLRESLDLFQPFETKKNTIVDCSVVAVYRKINACAVLSFDKFYKSKKLTFAEELVK